MQTDPRKEGLSWIRSLVPLVILTVPVWLLFASSMGGGVPARDAEASVCVRNIVNALKSYQNDYGHFPEIQASAPGGKVVFYVGDRACKVCEVPNSVIFDVLRAIPRGPNTDHALNPRKQKYFEGPKAKDPKRPRSGFADGLQFSASEQGCLLDPWGRQYCIAFTIDGSEQLDVSAVYSDLAGPENSIRSPVAAFSVGNDGIVGSKKYPGRYREPFSSSRPNDFVSWQ